MNVPNYLTALRILLIPIFVLAFYLPIPANHAIAATVFALACVTDWLDGYLARILGQTSRLGAFLDPVADKLVVVVALVLLVGEKGLPFLALPAMVIVGREIVISALREWMAELGKRTSVAVNLVGQFKTAIQMISLVLLLLYKPHGNLIVGILGYLLIYTAAILTLWSMFMYLKAAWPDLSQSQNPESPA